MANRGRDSALRTIFSFFLGLMLTAFVGVGVYTFHPRPKQFDDQIRDLSRREEAIRNSKAPDQLTTEDRSRIQDIVQQRDGLHDAAAAARIPWGRSTSVILIAFATLAMAVSLVRADQLPGISNGLLLGGIFTMLYGVGWIIATDTSILRFVVMSVALLITLLLGYVRFVRRPVAAAAGGPDLPESGTSPDIERRLQDLEERIQEAAGALGPRSDR